MKNLNLKPITDNDVQLVEMWLNKEYIKKWYDNPKDWLEEIDKRNDEYQFITHYIITNNNIPIGFCQYYGCFYAKEEWYQVNRPKQLFSIDYLIGDENYLSKGYGKEIIMLLTQTIIKNENLTQIIVKPNKKNIPSNKALISSGYIYDKDKQYYVYETKQILLENLDKIHTTKMGVDRIKKNLGIDVVDVVTYCKEKILNKNCNIYKQGKNWYCKIDNIVITVNSYSYTIITAHIIK